MASAYLAPLALIVLSNVAYQVCAKSMPQGMDPFAALTISYVVGAIASFVLLLVLNDGASIAREYAKVNWVPFVLGLAIVGLESGYIYAYRAGWSIATLPITQSALLAMALLIVGAIVFGESVTWTKVTGVVVCLVGLFLLSR